MHFLVAMPFGSATRTQKLRMIFMAWQLRVAVVSVAALAAENQSLKMKLGKRNNSIWEMKKADLVEVARQELGMTIAAAEKETVTTLREKIRANRMKLTTNQDPLTVLPKGLEKMTWLELHEEMQKRSLPTPQKITRPMMIVAIREQVACFLETIVMNPQVNPMNVSASQSSNQNSQNISAEAESMKVDAAGDRSAREKG